MTKKEQLTGFCFYICVVVYLTIFFDDSLFGNRRIDEQISKLSCSLIVVKLGKTRNVPCYTLISIGTENELYK